MNYIQIYSYSYSNTRVILKRLITSYFEKCISEKRPFGFAFKHINLQLQNYSKTIFVENFSNYEKNAYFIFNERYSFYSGEDFEVIKSVLEGEVKSAFIGDNYKSYGNFIREVAINKSILQVISHLNNYYSYYELIFQLNKFQYFYLEPFEGVHYESSNEYKEMLDVKYPYRLEEREAGKSMEMLESSSEDKNQNLNASKEGENHFKTLLESFNDDERLLIVNVFYASIKNKKFSVVSLTSFLKLIKIIGFYNDDSIFLGKAQNSTIYSKANKGIDYYSSDKTKILLLESTISKLDDLNLKEISNKLRMQLFSLNKTIR